MSKELIARIRKEGKGEGKGILNVSSFVNHKVDAALLKRCGEDLGARFKDAGITKVITGKALSLVCKDSSSLHMQWKQPIAAMLEVPMIFLRDKIPVTMKKEDALGVDIKSHTKGVVKTWYVNKNYVSCDDRILIIDDFLGTGTTAIAMAQLVKKAGAVIAGFGFLIAKTYEGGIEAMRASEGRGWEWESKDGEGEGASTAAASAAASNSGAGRVPIEANAAVTAVTEGSVSVADEVPSWV